jgi:4-amino-4-deoxy-L-arabinose transferase-like glycosyltransferase
VYPELWINDGALLSESVVVLVMACALHTMYTFWQRPTRRNAIVLGVMCGVAALGRNELILLFPMAVIPLALCARTLDWRPRIRRAAAACLAGAVVIAPWALFNLTRFNETTLTSSSWGSVLSAGNCDATYNGPSIGYYADCFHGPWPTGDESERDAEPRDQAVEYMKEHITRLPVVMLARVGRIWGAFKPGQTTFFDWAIEYRGRVASWLGLFAYYLLVPFAVGGLVQLWRRRVPILPLLAAPVIVTLAVAATFSVTRYRAPGEVSLVVAAALGMVAAVRWLRDRRPAAPTRELAAPPGTLAGP